MTDHGCAGAACRLCAYRDGQPDPTGGTVRTAKEARDVEAWGLLHPGAPYPGAAPYGTLGAPPR